MTDRELMQQALNYLDAPSSKVWAAGTQYKIIQALRARLAQPEPEPVAWVAYENGEKHGIDFDEDEIAKLPVGTMLYTAPPQRECQGLTNEPIGWIYEDDEGRIMFTQVPQNSPFWEPVYKAKNA